MTHDCGCLECKSITLAATRTAEWHVGVRFGDAPAPMQILLDGADVTGHCWEAYAGEPGWVIVYPLDERGARHACPRHHREPCRQQQFGRVELRASDRRAVA